ncbi:MAG: DUF5302 domain-containing protein [Ornithinimicrobium sp.]
MADQSAQTNHTDRPDEDEVKRKFREALDKKHSHGGTDVSDTTEHGKVAGSSGAKTSGAQQMFRRKSG